MPDTNNGLPDIDFTIDDGPSEKQPQKSIYPRWINSCERNKSCVMSQDVAGYAKELFEENLRLKEIKCKYEHLRTVALEGRQVLSSKVFVDFDTKQKSYRLRFVKHLKLSHGYKEYYTIRLYCDKSPSQQLVENRDADACKFWNSIDLKIKLTDNKGRVYAYPCDRNKEEKSLLVEEMDRTANYLILKVSFAQGEYAPIILKQNDIIEIEYAFSITTDHWGNYIERHVSFDREETIVYLKKGSYKLPDENSVRTVSKDEFLAPEVPLATFTLIEDENTLGYEAGYLGYRFLVDENYLTDEQLRSTNLRIRWDCKSIFGNTVENDIDDDDPGVASKGFGSN